MSDAVDKGEIQPSRIEHHSGSSAATEEWLRINLANIPAEIRPTLDDLPVFAAFFSTYLTSSFEIADGQTSRGEGLGLCRCEVCMTIINAPHLRSKKLYARDKRRAERLMKQSLSSFAIRNGMRISDKLITRLLASEESRRWAAFITYGDWLIKRLSGDSDGPAILALWRLIAWDPRGGVRRGFRLELDGFRNAERNLQEAIKSAT